MTTGDDDARAVPARPGGQGTGGGHGLRRARAQIADLRRKVEGLLAERTDSLNRGVDRVEAYAGDVAESVQYRYDDFQERVRERPVTALLIAVAIGYAFARLTGR